MVRQQRRADRSLPPAAASGVTWVRFPVSRRHLNQVDQTTTTEEEQAGPGSGPGPGPVPEPGPDGGLGDAKRTRLDGPDDATSAPVNRETVSGSCDQPGSDQQLSAENDDDRAAELQAVRSLKVTIQQANESREFRQTDRSADRQTGSLRCHVCDVICCSLQLFQDHMMGPEHVRKQKEITQTVSLQDRLRRPDVQRWCDICQSHFTGDVIVHRRTKQHKGCKQLSRPFCPVCRRHFRTPRKFVEHMKSAEHKEQVQQEEVQEEELITVDAVGCFEEKEEEQQEKEEEQEEEQEVDLAEEEGGAEEKGEEPNTELEADRKEYDPNTIYGSGYVLPVSGFLCRLCNKFFFKETTARHTHCRTHTHYLRLQNLRGQTPEDQVQDLSALS